METQPSRGDHTTASAPFGGRAGTPHVVGVDVGGTKVLVAVADANGRTLAEVVVPTETSSTHAFVDQLRGLVSRIVREANVDQATVRAITVGVPGTVDPATGRIRLAYNLPDLSGVILGNDLQRDWPEATVLVENDVNLAAVGEQWRGCAVDIPNFVAISVGTGIGAGVIIDGKILRGRTGAAGEIAYLPFGVADYDLTARPRGPLEEVLSGRAVSLGMAAGGAIDISPPTAAEVFAVAEAGDERALRVIDVQARAAAWAIAAMVAVLEPELVVLGGGIGASPIFVEPVRNHAKRLIPTPTPIEPSALGPRAALVGALGLGLQHTRSLIAKQPTILSEAQREAEQCSSS